MNDKMFTIFNNRVPKDCDFLLAFHWRIPIMGSTAELVIAPGDSRTYRNSSVYDYYAAWEEITAFPDQKKDCLYRVEFKPRPGWEEPPRRGFSLLFYSCTAHQIEGWSLSTGERISVPNQIPIKIHQVSPFSSEIRWAEIRIGRGQQYVRRTGAELAAAEERRSQSKLHPLTTPE